MFGMIPPLYRWAAIALAVALGALALAAWDSARLKRADAAGYKRAQGEADRAARAQQDRNRDLQRAAELRYTVQTETRDRFLTQTIVEIRHEAAPLAACPVPDAVRVRLNAAGRCAGGDPAASCGAGESVPVAR